jgi:hypothetical protein
LRRWQDICLDGTCCYGGQPSAECHGKLGTCTGKPGRCKRSVQTRPYAFLTLSERLSDTSITAGQAHNEGEWTKLNRQKRSRSYGSVDMYGQTALPGTGAHARARVRSGFVASPITAPGQPACRLPGLQTPPAAARGTVDTSSRAASNASAPQPAANRPPEHRKLTGRAAYTFLLSVTLVPLSC